MKPKKPEKRKEKKHTTAPLYDVECLVSTTEFTGIVPAPVIDTLEPDEPVDPAP